MAQCAESRTGNHITTQQPVDETTEQVRETTPASLETKLCLRASRTSIHHPSQRLGRPGYNRSQHLRCKESKRRTTTNIKLRAGVHYTPSAET
ncbi:hypothetical protein KC19_4G043400 [Ceratodon purpureus]|uniref:Uncharacterized protein n=1 Tax=Ceratodon purpureus TaxID=3225 RepID=A0A8T0I6U9_CERPU|nr:hypothetical protein KC19_4G043400 [Ceratodon purpureus]